MQIHPAPEPQPEAHQTVRLNLDTKNTTSSIRISFTDQRLTAHGGRIVWSHFLHQKRFRHQLRQVLPHDPTSPNAYDPTDVALGYVGGILCGADKLKLARAWSDYYGRPVHVSEFGCYTTADPQSRARFLAAFRHALDGQKLGWAMWDWSAAFRYWDKKNNQPMPGLHEALFGNSTR